MKKTFSRADRDEADKVKQGTCIARCAFTLVELLVVIAIISILMAMLLPALKMARDMGSQACCSSNLKQIHNAEFMYSTDYNSWPTPAWIYYGTLNRVWQNLLIEGEYLPIPFPGVSAKKWSDNISQSPYVEPQGILRCPSEKSSTYSSCDNTPAYRWDSSHYGMSFMYTNVSWGPSYVQNGRMSSCTNPSARIFFGDRCHYFCLIYSWHNPIPCSWHASRHNVGWNCLFLDGHVKWRRLLDTDGEWNK